MANTELKVSSTSRKPREGIQIRLADETVTYIVDVSEIASSVSLASTEIYRSTDNYTTDYRTSHSSGTPSVTGTSIRLPKMENLAAGVTYRTILEFTDEGTNVNRIVIITHCKANK